MRDLIDNNGTVENQYIYNAFGKLISSTTNASADTRYRYTGREWDAETGLDYNRARYYDESVGRFIGQDLIGFESGDNNLYRYVKNNPTNAVDPSGNVLIQVRMNKVVSRGSHSYIVVYDTPNGRVTNPWVFRGGPSEPANDSLSQARTVFFGGGYLITTVARYEKGGIDWSKNPSFVRDIYYKQCERADLWKAALSASLSRIQAARFPYRILGPNSNSVTRQALRDIGFDFPVQGNFWSRNFNSPQGLDGATVPGWDNLLFDTPVGQKPDVVKY